MNMICFIRLYGNTRSLCFKPGSTLSHVYFPTTAIISLLYVMECGAAGEIAVVDNEGIVGISLFMGESPPPAARWCKAPRKECD
jgi:hypothetical protein